MRFSIHFTLILAFSAALSAPLFSSDNLKASLIIVGPGDPVYTYWGHIGIAVENIDSGESLFYDFGNFSFYSDNFYKDFAMGRMVYLGIVTPTDYFISYSLAENRDFTIYPLNLGNEALKELDDTLRWWVLPENREYLYDYFLNNCATIIRDILNDITDGELKRISESDPDLNFRYYARTGAAPSFFWEITLHYLLGSDMDKPITGWDKMFLPQTVADYISTMKYRGRDGTIRTLSGEGNALKYSTRQPVPDNPRTLWPVMLLTGLVLGFLWRISGRVKRKSFKITAVIVRAVIIMSIGLPGLILGFLMVFTNHASAYHNINVWPFFPTILIGLIILFIPFTKKELWLSRLWQVNLLGLVLAVILRVSGIYIQDAYAFWVLMAPLTLAASFPFRTAE